MFIFCSKSESLIGSPYTTIALMLSHDSIIPYISFGITPNTNITLLSNTALTITTSTTLSIAHPKRIIMTPSITLYFNSIEISKDWTIIDLIVNIIENFINELIILLILIYIIIIQK